MAFCKLNQITYRIGQNTILDNISAQFHYNTKTFILGNNGSGKTSLIDLMLGNLKESSGEKILDNKEKDFGVLFDTVPFSPILKVKEIVNLLSLIYQVSNNKKLLDDLQLTELLNKKIKVLSLGEKKRLGIFAALIHNPKVLVLDEPFGGIDANSVNTISKLLFDTDRTVIVSSHNWDIAAKTADKILFLKEGKMLLKGLHSPQKLLSTDYIAFNKKLVLEKTPQSETIINNGKFKEFTTLEYDNLYHIFHDDNLMSRNLIGNDISYRIEPKNLNDVYNFILQSDT